MVLFFREKYYSKLPKKEKERSEIHSYPRFQKYPFYLLEIEPSKNPVQPFMLDELVQKIATYKFKKEENITYYCFLEDYYGIKPGEKYMTPTDHHHPEIDWVAGIIERHIEKQTEAMLHRLDNKGPPEREEGFWPRL